MISGKLHGNINIRRTTPSELHNKVMERRYRHDYILINISRYYIIRTRSMSECHGSRTRFIVILWVSISRVTIRRE